MRVGFINAVTGTVMEVDESRVEEYKAAGHKLAADSFTEKPAEEGKGKKPVRGKKK